MRDRRPDETWVDWAKTLLAETEAEIAAMTGKPGKPRMVHGPDTGT